MQNKKANKLYLFIFVILMMILCSCLNQNQGNSSVKIKSEEEIQEIDYDTIYTNENAISFPSVVRSSGKKPVETEFKGVELSKLFEAVNIDAKSFDKFTFVGSDGYSIMLKREEILQPNNAYLVFERDGEKLKTSNSGSGPFQLIIRTDSFSQRWVKRIVEITLE